MKTIKQSLIAICAIILTACSPSETLESTTIINQETTATENTRNSQANEVVLLEELVYLSLYQEYGPNSDIVQEYLNYFDELAGGIPKGCGPKPQPCDIISNCETILLTQDVIFQMYGNPENAFIKATNPKGNTIAQSYGFGKGKCPNPKNYIINIEGNIYGEGFLYGEMYSPVIDDMISFEVRFAVVD